jgi:Domain of unknown function (DUF4184)
VPAHQALVLPLKLAFPRYFDGTALFIGAAAPDLGYAIEPRGVTFAHTLEGVLLWAVPFTLVVVLLLRRGAAKGVFAQLPDLGPLRIRSYRVLSSLRPSLLVTMYSVVLGAGSHVVLDAFTHKGRWGAELLGTDAITVDLPGAGAASLTRTMQYLGHSFGSLIGLGLLLYIGHRRLLEAWYSERAVEVARRVRVTMGQRVVFWSLVSVVALLAGTVAVVTNRFPLFHLMLGTAVGLVLVGLLPLYRDDPEPPFIAAPDGGGTAQATSRPAL